MAPKKRIERKYIIIKKPICNGIYIWSNWIKNPVSGEDFLEEFTWFRFYGDNSVEVFYRDVSRTWGNQKTNITDSYECKPGLEEKYYLGKGKWKVDENYLFFYYDVGGRRVSYYAIIPEDRRTIIIGKKEDQKIIIGKREGRASGTRMGFISFKDLKRLKREKEKK